VLSMLRSIYFCPQGRPDPCQPRQLRKTATSSPLADKKSASAPCLPSSVWSCRSISSGGSSLTTNPNRSEKSMFLVHT
jgi:hypothetical protein